MAQTEEGIEAGIGQMADAVRDAARFVSELTDDEALLRASQALGVVAGAVIGFRETVAPRPISSSISESVAEVAVPAAIVASAEAADAKEIAPPVSAAPAELSTPEPIFTSTAETHEPDSPPAETDVPAGEVRQFIIDTLPHGTFTERESVVVRYLEGNPGTKFSPAQLKDLIPGPSQTARQQAFNRIIIKMQTIPAYGNRLNIEGQRNARRYWLRDEIPAEEAPSTLAAPTDVGHSSSRAFSPSDMPQRRPAEIAAAHTSSIAPEGAVEENSQTIIPLTTWGLGVSQNGHRRIERDGVPLRLTTVAVDALAEIAQHETGLTFDALRQSLSARWGHELSPQTIRKALEDIAGQLGADTEHFSDEIIDDAGEPDRHIRLIGLVPQEERAGFLEE